MARDIATSWLLLLIIITSYHNMNEVFILKLEGYKLKVKRSKAWSWPHPKLHYIYTCKSMQWINYLLLVHNCIFCIQVATIIWNNFRTILSYFLNSFHRRKLVTWYSFGIKDNLYNTYYFWNLIDSSCMPTLTITLLRQLDI